MSRSATHHPHSHYRLHLLARAVRRRIGLPSIEMVWGALFLIGISCALALAIWSSFQAEHTWM